MLHAQCALYIAHMSIYLHSYTRSHINEHNRNIHYRIKTESFSKEMKKEIKYITIVKIYKGE